MSVPPRFFWKFEYSHSLTCWLIWLKKPHRALKPRGSNRPPKILKVILLLKCSAKSAKKHTKRKLSLTQTKRHAKIRVQPLFSEVKSFLKIFGEWMCPYDFSENSHIATPWYADKSDWRNPTGHWNLGVQIDPQNFWKLFSFTRVRRKAPKSTPNESSR